MKSVFHETTTPSSENRCNGRVQTREKRRNGRSAPARWGVAALLAISLLLTGCSGNVGVGMSVGVPIGDHGYMSIGGGRWL